MAGHPVKSPRKLIEIALPLDAIYQQGGGFKFGKNNKDAALERRRLFKIIEDLVLRKNTIDVEVLERAPDTLPTSHSHFSLLTSHPLPPNPHSANGAAD